MHDPLNLNQVRHEQRRVAALLNQSKNVEMHAVPYSGIPLDQLYKSRYHEQLMNGGAIATSSSWDTGRQPMGGRDLGDAMDGKRKTLAEKAYDIMDRLNFPNKHSNMRKVHDANRKNISDGRKMNSDTSETPMRRDSVSKSENFRDRAKGRRTRPLGGVRDIQSQSLRESLMVSSREGAREVPYRLPKKQEITRNLEVAIARSRRNKANIEGKNLRPLKIPTGQNNWEKKDLPVVHLKYKHDSKGKGLNLGLRFSDQVTEISPVPFTPPPIKIPTQDRVDSASSGVGSYSAHSTSYDDTAPLSPTTSRVSSGFGTYRTEENDERHEQEQKEKEDRLSREHTADVLWFQRHGHTKSAWLRKRMRDEAAKRKREAEVLRQLDNMVDDEDEENMTEKTNQRTHDGPPTKHAHMEAYRQAYIKAVAVARSRALPQEPWLLGTRTSRSFTFSYFAHVPTCSCGQCYLKNKESNPVKRGHEMKAIFGDVKMMDYFKPPRVVRSKRRFNKKKRELEKTLMGSLTEEGDAAAKSGQEKEKLVLPPINGPHDDENADDRSDEENSNDVDDLNDIPGEEIENEDAMSEKEDNLSSRGTLSDDEEGVAAAKNDTSKRSEETSGYDSESSGET